MAWPTLSTHRLLEHPWRRLVRHLEREGLFPGFPAGPEARAETEVFPALNLQRSADGTLLVQLELPGFDPASIDVRVENGVLEVAAERKESPLAAGETWHRRERPCGRIRRRVALPHAVELDETEAAYERGVLEVRLPRARSDRPRKIDVKGG